MLLILLILVPSRSPFIISFCAFARLAALIRPGVSHGMKRVAEGVGREVGCVGALVGAVGGGVGTGAWVGHREGVLVGDTDLVGE